MYNNICLWIGEASRVPTKWMSRLPPATSIKVFETSEVKTTIWFQLSEAICDIVSRVTPTLGFNEPKFVQFSQRVEVQGEGSVNWGRDCGLHKTF